MEYQESKSCRDFYYIYQNNKLIDFKFIKNGNNRKTNRKVQEKIQSPKKYKRQRSRNNN